MVQIGVDAAGLDADTIRGVVTDKEKLQRVFTKAKKWSELGVSGALFHFHNATVMKSVLS